MNIRRPSGDYIAVAVELMVQGLTTVNARFPQNVMR
jgi:hypothetical protein